MAIFIKDLESIEISNKRNLVKTTVDSEVIHFINYQNTDDELSDLRFELNTNFKMAFDKNRFYFRKLKNNSDFQNFENLFKKFNSSNKIIFESLETILSAIIAEDDKLNSLQLRAALNDFSPELYSKNKKPLFFDSFTHFLYNLKKFKNGQLSNDSQVDMIKFANTNNVFLSYFSENNNAETRRVPKINFFEKMINTNVSLFVKNFLGFNFIDINDNDLIQGKKPYSLLSLATTAENILHYSFDDMTTNSLFYGFYTNEELNKKFNFSKLTNNIFYEHDITKEIIPIKYTNNYNLITKEKIKLLIDNLNLINTQDRIITQKNADELIDNSLFHTAKNTNIFNIQQNTNVKYVSKMLDDDEVLENLSPTQKGLLSGVIAQNIYNLESNSINLMYRTHKMKTKKSVLQAMNLICATINSKKVKMMYGNFQQENITNGKYDTTFMKYHNINDNNNTGIFNFDLPYMIGAKSNETISSILRNRLLSNNIVKKYKKIKMNHGLDSSQNVEQNKLRFLLNSSQLGIRAGSKTIGAKYNTFKDIDFVNSIKRKMNVNASRVNDILKLFSAENHLKNIFQDNDEITIQLNDNSFKEIDRNILNHEFFFRNNKILGESNLPEYLQFKNGFNNTNDELINTSTLLSGREKIIQAKSENAQDLNTLKTFANQYYNDSFQSFKSTATFFESISEICQEYIKEMQKVSEQDPTTYSQASLHADLLQTAVIFKYFLDSSRQNQNSTDTFSNDFVNLLMMDEIVSKYGQSNHKLQFFEKWASIFANTNNKIFDQEMITSIAPFHIFFMNEDQKVEITNNQSRRSQSTKNLDLIANNGRDENYNSLTNINIYETNGLFTHFINTNNTPVETNMLYSSLLNNTLNNDAQKIPLAGYNILENMGNYVSSPKYRRYVLFIPTIKPSVNGYAIQMYLNFKKDSEISNEYTTFNYTLTQSNFKYSTSNLYNPLNPQNSNINIIQTMKRKNIFNKLSSLFESLIVSQVSNNTNLNTLLDNNLSEEISNIKQLLNDTLLIAGELYLNMFYKLQGYTNVSNRIHMSNILNARWPYFKDHDKLTSLEMYSYFYYNRRRKNSTNDSLTILRSEEEIILNGMSVEEQLNNNLNSLSILPIERLDQLNQKFHSDSNLFSFFEFPAPLCQLNPQNISLKKMLYLFNEIFFDTSNENTKKLSLNILQHLNSQQIKLDGVDYTVLSSYRDLYVRNAFSTRHEESDYTNVYDQNINVFELFNLSYDKNINSSHDSFVINDRYRLTYKNYKNLSNVIIDKNTIDHNIFEIVNLNTNSNSPNTKSHAQTLQIKESSREFVEFTNPSNILKFVTPSDISNSLISKSYTFKNYDYSITKENGQKYYGSNNIETIESNSFGFQELYRSLTELISNGINVKIEDIKFIDINESWYQHIIAGLLMNDISLSMLFDYLIYFKGGFLYDIEILTRQISEEVNITRSNSDLTAAIRQLNNASLNKKQQQLDQFSYISKNNTKIQNLYFQYIQKYKMTKNIVDLCDIIRRESQDINNQSTFYNLIEKIIKNNTQDSDYTNNTEFLFNYFDDSFIKKIYESQNNINNLYTVTDHTNRVVTQSQKINGSNIITVGFKNEEKIKWDKDDILSVKVELIDHDFPEVVWEPKIFEFHASLENPDNIVLKYFDNLFDKTITSFEQLNINMENIPLKILNNYEISQNIQLTNSKSDNFKDALIKNISQEGGNVEQYPNFTNNINSKTYITADQSQFKSIINPIDFHNNTAYIITKIGIENVTRKIVSYFNKYNQLGNETQISITKITSIAVEMLKRCIHNQRMSFKLQKMIKLISGFEPTVDFSFNIAQDNNISSAQRDVLLGKYILQDVYNIYIGNVSNFNNYDFTKEEIDAVINKTAIRIGAQTVYKVLISEKHNINVFLKFLSDFSKSLMHENMLLLGNLNSFEKIVNIAVNPKDFIVAGLKGSGERDFIPVSPELEFVKINSRGVYIDEIGTEPNYILRYLTEFTMDRESIDYYRVYKKSDNTAYIPKNVSYRISTTILK